MTISVGLTESPENVRILTLVTEADEFLRLDSRTFDKNRVLFCRLVILAVVKFFETIIHFNVDGTDGATSVNNCHIKSKKLELKKCISHTLTPLTLNSRSALSSLVAASL